jgi:hypothetical protein
VINLVGNLKGVVADFQADIGEKRGNGIPIVIADRDIDAPN